MVVNSPLLITKATRILPIEQTGLVISWVVVEAFPANKPEPTYAIDKVYVFRIILHLVSPRTILYKGYRFLHPGKLFHNKRLQ